MTAQESVHSLMNFNADPNVLVAVAHDPTSLDVFDFFLTGTMMNGRRKVGKNRFGRDS